MSTDAYVITLVKFEFPEWLEEGKCDFRLQVDLRYKDSNGDFRRHVQFLPELDQFWECSEREQREKAQDREPDREYVLGADRKLTLEDGDSREKVGVWGRVFRLRATALYEMRVTVFDVERRNWWDRVVNVLSDIRSVLVSLPVGVAKVEAGDFTLKSVTEDAMASIGRRLADGKDRVLVVGSAKYTDASWTIRARGFTIAFTGAEMEGNRG